MSRSLQLMLIALLIVQIIAVAASRPSASAMVSFKIDREITVAPLSPRAVLEVRYPNGGSTLYEGGRIPGSVTVPVGSRVELRIFGRVKEPGTYTARSSAQSMTDLPDDSHMLQLMASAAGSNATGNIEAIAAVSIQRYYQGMTVRLEVYYTASTDEGSDSFYKIVTVRVQPQQSLTTLTFIPPATTSSSQPLTTSSTTSPGTVRWITSTTQVRGLSISPSGQEVDAGQIAIFDVCPSLESPKFRVENLPTGYRYIMSKDGSCYKLKIFTHPLSYGTFDMNVVAYAGNVEERSSISLTVRKTQTSSQAPSTSSMSPTTSSSTPTSKPTIETGQATTTSQQSTTATRTVITVTQIVPGGSSMTDALGVVAGALGLVLVLLLVRRRS